MPSRDEIAGERRQDLASGFGDNLRRARRHGRVSQAGLASLARLNRDAIGRLERGERLARLDTIVKIASALEIAPGALLDGLRWTPGRGADRLDGGRFYYEDPRSLTPSQLRPIA